MLAPKHGKIAEVQWRPADNSEPISWTVDASSRARHGSRRRADGRRLTTRCACCGSGPLEVDPPVVLAPMAGITNAAYRSLCREQGAGLYVCEMITSRGLVERDEMTLAMLVFDPVETVRSVQLYGVDPAYMAGPRRSSARSTASGTST